MHLGETESQIPQRVIEAYRNAVYRILIKPSCDLTIGVHSFELDVLLASCGRDTAALLTACNPGGVLQDTYANQFAQRQLFTQLNASTYDLFPAVGLSPIGDWPAEESVLIAGVGLEEAMKLGRSFKQNALLFVQSGEAPQLVLLR